jgi:hypothetical protein
MTPGPDAKKPSELKPGDLYVVTGVVAGKAVWFTPDVNQLSLAGRLKLVCRHECGALEFLVLPEVVK